MATVTGVATPSVDYLAMAPYWSKVDDILGGADRMRAAGQKYLPQLPAETDEDYAYRVSTSPFTNVVNDVVESLASKPFQSPVQVNEPGVTEEYLEDIDGEGHDITAFASGVFYSGLAYSLHWVFVDMPQRGESVVTLADSARANMRPYWQSINAIDMIAVEVAKVGGNWIFTHCRFRESEVRRDNEDPDDYSETIIDRIREYNREPVEGEDGTITGYGAPAFRIWERELDENVITRSGALTVGRTGAVRTTAGTFPQGEQFEMIAEGELRGMDEIPLRAFMTGRRNGRHFQFKPLLEAVVDLQLSLFLDESSLQNAKDATAFPMLAGNGVEPERDEAGNIKPVMTGGKRVLFSPPTSDTGGGGSWSFIEPTATSLQFLADANKEKIREMREMGKQPMTAQTANQTVVSAKATSSKGDSAILAAATLLDDTLSECLALTAKWLGSRDEPQAQVFKDFEAESLVETQETVLGMYDRDLVSAETAIDEAKRRKILSPNVDADEEAEKILDESSTETADEAGMTGAGTGEDNAATVDAEAA